MRGINILILRRREPRLNKAKKLAQGQMANQEIKLRLLRLQSLVFPITLYGPWAIITLCFRALLHDLNHVLSIPILFSSKHA